MQGRQLLASLEILPAAGDMATVDITATAGGGPAAAARAAPPASIGIAGIETEGGALNGVYELNGSFPHVEGQRRPQWMMPGTRRYVRYQVKGGREPWIPRRHKRGGTSLGRRGGAHVLLFSRGFKIRGVGRKPWFHTRFSFCLSHRISRLQKIQ